MLHAKLCRGVCADIASMSCCSRELADTAGPGSGLVASIILGLALAWSNVEAPEAQAGFELQYMVRRQCQSSLQAHAGTEVEGKDCTCRH